MWLPTAEGWEGIVAKLLYPKLLAVMVEYLEGDATNMLAIALLLISNDY